MSGSDAVRAYLAGESIPEYELIRACWAFSRRFVPGRARMTNVVQGSYRSARMRGGNVKQLLRACDD